MKDVRYGLAVSIVIHLCVLALLITLSFSSRKPLVVLMADLTLVAGPEGTKKALSGAGTKARNGGSQKAGVETRGPAAAAKQASAAGNPAPSPAPARLQGALPVPASDVPVLAGATGERTIQGGQGGASPEGESRSSRLSAHGGQGAGSSGAAGQGSGSGGGEGIQGGDYYYIRDMVLKNVTYPEKARRMGLEGRVLLSFMVVETGVTRDVKVLHTSGFRLLDENAKEAVEKTVIRKKVPYRVAVTLPITYKLQ